MTTKNLINQILNKRGFKKYTPTDELLSKMEITVTRFNKIIENKTEMTASELQKFSVWLDTPIQNLLLLNKDDKKPIRVHLKPSI